MVEALKRDYRSAPISRQDKAMLDYVVKLTKDATKCSPEDHARLRAAGFDDRAILQITLIAAWFNYINRDNHDRSEEHTSELQSRLHLVCRLLLEKKKKTHIKVRYLEHATSTRLDEKALAAHGHDIQARIQTDDDNIARDAARTSLALRACVERDR